MTIHRAAQGVLVDRDGYFKIKLAYSPGYDSVAATLHTLIEFSPTVRLIYRGSDDKIVYDNDGVELASDALTFLSGDTIAIELEHTADRRRLRVTGASAGDGLWAGEPAAGIDPASMIYVLGPSTRVLEEMADLVELCPLGAITFAQLVDDRALVQMDRLAVAAMQDFIDFLQQFTTEAASIHDTALLMRDSFDLLHADGDQLDLIGENIGLDRQGFDDDLYRRYLDIQVELLLSAQRDGGEWTGTIPNILRIARKFIGDGVAPIRYEWLAPYNFRLQMPVLPPLTVAQARLLLSFISTAIYAGVRGWVEIPETDDVWGSDALTVTDVGIWGSDSVVVTDASVWDLVLITS